MNDLKLIDKDNPAINSIYTDLGKIKILHIDDDTRFLSSIKRLIDSKIPEFAITSVESVDEALYTLKNNEIDVILADYFLPRRNGLYLYESMKQMNLDIPFILFTGYMKEEIIITALNLGVDFYIIKRTDPSFMLSEIKQYVNRAFLYSESQKQLKLNSMLLNNATDMILLADTEGKTIYHNKATNELLGYTELEFQHLDLINLVENVSLLKENWKKLNHISKNIFEIDFVKKDGTKLPVEIHLKKIDINNIEYYLSVVRDITQRKQLSLAESKNKLFIQELYESDERFLQIFNNSPFGMVFFFLDLNLLNINDAFSKILGYSKSELIGINLLDLIEPENRDVEQKLIQELFNNKIPHYKSKRKYIKSDMSLISLEWTCSTVKGINGEIMYAFGVINSSSEK